MEYSLGVVARVKYLWVIHMLFIYLSLLNTPEEREYFTDLYNTYRDMMMYIARQRLKEQDAEDAMHNAFMRLASRKNSVLDIPAASARSYLAAAVKNACVDILRKYHPVTPIEEAEAIPDYKPEPDKVLLQKSDVSNMVAVINQLPEDYASTMWCVFSGGLTYKQAAGLLGTTPHAIKERVHRGRQMLMNRMYQEARHA